MKTLAHRLERWYAAGARDLPWRRNPSGYRVWVSEIMLQQTRVETVIPYYRRFIKRFPSLKALAGAPLDEVLALWSGLGYYRRARMLHAGAREVRKRHGGRLPRQAAALRSLPGIGRYTAGAILSIAFGQPEPVLDGNVERVLSRLSRTGGPVKSAAVQRRLWGLATKLVESARRPDRLNQALMELGATVCRPISPDCRACPLSRDCQARAAGDPESFPDRRRRLAVQEIRYALLIARDAQGRVLLLRRDGEKGASLLPRGLWELPHAVWREGSRVPLAKLRRRAGVPCRVGRERASVRHTITNHRLELIGVGARLRGGVTFPAILATERDVARLPISSAIKKLLAAACS